MAEPAGAPSGGGDRPNPPSPPGGGSGSPPAPASGAGGTPPPNPPSPGTIPIEVLPEQLRGMPESSIRFTLNKMVESLAATNRRNQELEAQLRDPKPGRSTPLPADPRDDPKPRTKKPLDQMLLEDPETALTEFLTEKFSAPISKLNELDERLGRSELSAVRSEIDDFSEYEAEVVDFLERARQPKTRDNLMGAYTMLVGQKTIEERQRNRRAALNSDTPAPEGGEPKKEYKKTPLHEEIRLGLGQSEEDYYENFSSPDSVSSRIKVPR